MNLKIKLIAQQLKRLAVYYPQNRRTREELALLTKMWMEDLGHLTDDAFLAAVKLARARSEWFLTPKNILDAHQEIINKPKQFVQITKDTKVADLDFVRKLRKIKGV